MPGATYAIGPSDFFTSGDLEADAKLVDDQARALDAAIEGNESVPASFHDAWGMWLAQWREFYADKFEGFFDFLVALNDANRDRLVSFERQLADWQTQAAAFGAEAPGPSVGPSGGSGDSLKNHLPDPSKILPDTSTIIVLVVAVIVGLVAWKVLA